MENQERVEVPQYIKKPRSIVQDKRLTTTEGDYLALIGGLQNAGSCFASNGFFADYFGVSITSAKTILRQLRQKRFVITYRKTTDGGKTIRRHIEVVDQASRAALLTNEEEPIVEAVENAPDSQVAPPKQPVSDGCQTLPPMGAKPYPAMGVKPYPIYNNIYKTKNTSLSLAEFFLKYRRKVSSDCQVNLESWTADFDRLIRSGNDPQTIRRAIRWVSREKCWWYGKSNTGSPQSFAKNFEKIEKGMAADDSWVDKSCHFCGGDEDTVCTGSKKLGKTVYYHRECREHARQEKKKATA